MKPRAVTQLIRRLFAQYQALNEAKLSPPDLVVFRLSAECRIGSCPGLGFAI